MTHTKSVAIGVVGAVALLLAPSLRSAAAAEADCSTYGSCERACAKGDKPACARIEGFLVHRCEKSHDGEACAHLAVLYNAGGPLPTSQERWIKYASKACELGHGGGCSEVGVGYAQGLGGLVKNDGRAVEYFKKACDLGDALGCRNYGGRLLNGKGVTRDPRAARAALQTGCDGKDAGSCTKLGNILDAGEGGTKDSEGAGRLYERGCQLGDQLACDNARNKGRQVEGPRWDVERVRTSCDAGFQLDCWELGRMYFYGRGVPIDQARALAIVSRSCRARWPESCDLAARWLEDGTGAKRDVKKALRLYQQACTLGLPEGCDHAGDVLRVGRTGFAAHPAAAVEWYARGCDRGYERACFGLGTVLNGVPGVAADHQRANAALEKACAAKLACACNDLAVSYWTGRGVPVDMDKAKELLSDACQNGCEASCGFESKP